MIILYIGLSEITIKAIRFYLFGVRNVKRREWIKKIVAVKNSATVDMTRV